MTYKTVDYNAWHSQHTKDDDITAPWHKFAVSCLAGLDLSKKTILEIGCGRGGLSNYIASHYSETERLISCDYSSSAIKIASEKYLDKHIEWRVQDIQKMEFEDNSIDVAISCETIEHVPSSLKAIQELFRVLKPGGHLILTCPNYFNLFGLWCLYRYFIGKPYDEGGQPFVKYILMPTIYFRLRKTGFRLKHYHSSDLVIPARRPIHFFQKKLPGAISFLGIQTCYLLEKTR